MEPNGIDHQTAATDSARPKVADRTRGRGINRRTATAALAAALAAAAVAATVSGIFSSAPPPEPEIVVYTSDGERVRTLDPVLASDLASSNIVTALFDTLLQYDYVERPYKLIPSMLAKMPEVNADNTVYTCTLRDDLFFHPDPCFGGEKVRVTSRDAAFSFLRLADARLHSSAYWLIRGKLLGIEEFREKTLSLSQNDYSCYDSLPAGIELVDDLTVRFRLAKPDPRFNYVLAMPNSAVVSRRAVEFYGESFPEHPVGSGPFMLTEWLRDHHLILDRFPDFREEYFVNAPLPSDRTRRLPLADRLVCYAVRQPLTCWMLFLQGKLDISRLDKDNLDVVLSAGGALSPALKARNIELLRQPGFEIQYIGYNFDDPTLGGNIDLRRAINLAFNLNSRIEHSNMQMAPANGPLPPNVAGYDPKARNPYNHYDVSAAAELLTKAGYPGGVNPATGEPLKLSFDLNGNSPMHRQIGELMAADMKKIGIELEVNLNNSPRFFQKLRQNEMQLFRLSWAGDYPDAENFLQLFYSGNAGGSNRTNFRNAEFDRLFEKSLPMPDSPERTALYQEMVELLLAQQPWIFESYPIRFRLKYPWMRNYLECDFDFVRWKYLTVDPDMRKKMTGSFKPLSFSELNGE